MRKRSAVAFSGMLVALMAIIVRVLELSQGGLSKAAEQQSSLTITVANVRGTIYDRNLRPLVNGRTSYRACVAGFPEAIAAVAPQLDEQAMAELEERLRTNRPAVVTLAEPPSLASGLAFFRCRNGIPAICCPRICWDIWMETAFTESREWNRLLTIISPSIPVRLL